MTDFTEHELQQAVTAALNSFDSAKDRQIASEVFRRYQKALINIRKQNQVIAAQHSAVVIPFPAPPLQ